MSADRRNTREILTALGSCGLAATWYAVATRPLASVVSPELATYSALAVAALVPVLALRGQQRRTRTPSEHSLAQKFDALNMHTSISITDANEILTDVNDQMLTLTGFTREELIGQSVRKLYEIADQQVASEIRANLIAGHVWKGETPLRHKDGHQVFTQTTILPLFDDTGNWTGAISARTDITGSKELVAERHTAEMLYELRDEIWVLDATTESFCYMNRAARQRFGLSDDDFHTRNFDDFDVGTEFDVVLQACRDLKNGSSASSQFDAVLQGVPSHVTLNYIPGRDDKGRYLVQLRDDSDRVEQERLKSAFLSTVSHELRSPLTSIKGAMGLLLSNAAGEIPDNAAKLLEISHRNADRLILIINDLLDLDKMASGQMETEISQVDLVSVVNEANLSTSMLQHRFGVSVDVIAESAPVVVPTDANRAMQVLTNLLSNAYKFSKPGGKIMVEIVDREDTVRVSVTDHGPGIPKSEQHKIFDRFADMSTSLRSSKGGTGLGLSICKAIVETLGGQIGFTSELGQGTTFYFDLPKHIEECDASPVRLTA